jgi:hypothetical protein
VKVLDFGVAQLRDATSTEHTRAGTALGTPSFMSPEQARGLGDKLDGRADLFSVGAILYALLSGTRLHAGRNNDEALILAATQPAPSVARVAPDLPVEVIALIDKALAWDRRQRFADAAEMRAAVRALLEKHGVRRPARPSSAVAGYTGDVGEADLEDAPPEETAAPESLIAAEDDPAVERLRSIFRQLERVLPSVRQYGWAHPETERKVRAAFEEIAAALVEAPETLAWSVRAYSFAHRGREVWEPPAPLDVVPYGFFQAGLREMKLLPGLSEPELRRLLATMLLDPALDLAPEDDLATVLWELELPHVRFECADGFAEGGAAQREAFFEEADRLEALAARAAEAARAEARAMTVQTDQAGLAEDPIAAALAIDPTTRAALGTALAVPNDRWTERYVDALVDALLETRRAGDAELVLAPLAASVADWIVAGRAGVAVSMLSALLQGIGARVRGEEARATSTTIERAIFGGQTLALALQALSSQPDEAARAPLVAIAARALSIAPPSELPRVLAALPLTADERLREPMLVFLARAAQPTDAGAVAQRVGELDADLAAAVLAGLAALPHEGARAIVGALGEGTDPLLRLSAALSRASSPQELRAELTRAIEDAREDVRLAGLRAVAARGLKELGPPLVHRAEDASFHALSADERREILRALFALHPSRAERLAIELLSQRQLIKNEARERSRAIAAQVLGELAATGESLAALANAAKGGWGTSDELKHSALAATKAIEERTRGTAARAPRGAS